MSDAIKMFNQLSTECRSPSRNKQNRRGVAAVPGQWVGAAQARTTAEDPAPPPSEEVEVLLTLPPLLRTPSSNRSMDNLPEVGHNSKLPPRTPLTSLNPSSNTSSPVVYPGTSSFLTNNSNNRSTNLMDNLLNSSNSRSSFSA